MGYNIENLRHSITCKHIEKFKNYADELGISLEAYVLIRIFVALEDLL